MPLCYGGGVQTIEQFEKIVGLGVEKVAIASAAIKTPELVSLRLVVLAVRAWLRSLMRKNLVFSGIKKFL